MTDPKTPANTPKVKKPKLGFVFPEKGTPEDWLLLRMLHATGDCVIVAHHALGTKHNPIVID